LYASCPLQQKPPGRPTERIHGAQGKLEEACPGKFLSIRPSEIGFESNFSSSYITAFKIH